MRTRDLQTVEYQDGFEIFFRHLLTVKTHRIPRDPLRLEIVVHIQEVALSFVNPCLDQLPLVRFHTIRPRVSACGR